MKTDDKEKGKRRGKKGQGEQRGEEGEKKHTKGEACSSFFTLFIPLNLQQAYNLYRLIPIKETFVPAALTISHPFSTF